MIRVLSAGDVADYRGIRLATLACEPEFFGADYATEAARPLWEFETVLRTATVFGAYAAGAIVGVIRLHRQPGRKQAHKAAVHGFFVRPEQRGRGVGAALMRELLAAARRSVEQVSLSVVAENAAAIALYGRFGFTVYGIEARARRSRNGYQDMVLMALRLQ